MKDVQHWNQESATYKVEKCQHPRENSLNAAIHDDQAKFAKMPQMVPIQWFSVESVVGLMVFII